MQLIHISFQRHCVSLCCIICFRSNNLPKEIWNFLFQDCTESDLWRREGREGKLPGPMLSKGASKSGLQLQTTYSKFVSCSSWTSDFWKIFSRSISRQYAAYSKWKVVTISISCFFSLFIKRLPLIFPYTEIYCVRMKTFICL